jgi:hypothetical protein
MWCICLLVASVVGAGNLHPRVEQVIFDSNGTITKIDAVNRAVELNTVDARTRVVTSAASSSAHVTFRVVGTIAKVTATKLDVTNKDGRIVTMDLTRRTVIRRLKEEKKLPISALNAGQSVVVDAFNAYAEDPDDDSDLEALDIRIVPAISAKPGR